MTNDQPAREKQKTSFWDTTMGTITKMTALLTAITGLVLAVKPFLKSGGGGSSSQVIKAPPDSIIQQPAVDYKATATAVANEWCEDLKNKNLDRLVSNSSVPFYADNKILNSLSEVRESYRSITEKMYARSIPDSSGRITSVVPELFELKIYKASELANKGFDITHDRLFNSLNLEDDPYVGSLAFRTNGREDYVELVFRKTGNSLKIAGWWD